MDFYVATIFYMVALIGLCIFVIDEAIDSRKPKHIWKQTGYWDGRDKNNNRIAGPMAKCIHCGEEKNFRRDEWNALPKEIKIEFESEKLRRGVE